MNKKCRNLCRDASGAVAVFTALGLTVFLGFAALALDVGHMLSMKNELQRAADAGAMAGARGLWSTTLPIINNPPLQPDCATAQSVALSVGTNINNKVDGAVLTSAKVTVQTGRWDYVAKQFTAGCTSNTNAVQVITQSTVPMFFAGILGQGPKNLTATAVAVMDFAINVGKGTIPIAISQHFVTAGQILFVNFTNDTVDNAAWFADPPSSASAKTFKDYIDNNDCPPLHVGDVINLQNGQDASVLQDLQNKLAQQLLLTPLGWDLILPVVNTTTFNGSQPIAGFVPFRMTSVTDTGGHKGITGTVLGLEESATAQPGGINFGVLAPPKSVL